MSVAGLVVPGAAVDEALYESGWCQRTTERVPSWRHTSEGGFDPRNYHVFQISEEVAKAFVLLHHYSRSYPVGRLAYGMLERHHLVGVAVLGEPMHPKVITNPFPTLDNRTGAELSRLVLIDEVPANGESRHCCSACNNSTMWCGSGAPGVASTSQRSSVVDHPCMLHPMRQRCVPWDEEHRR
ncbi:hypothetical protein [Actinoplanes sp. G11-F43]|uniref:Mom family adenine methylcarbamoylation protein n=1 Tax=Actinoplanes sp. G11-F43 TaxID=3424130 RepID=UPI003D33DB8C